METELFKPFPLNPAVMVGNLGTIIRPNKIKCKQSKHNLGYLCCGVTIAGKVKSWKVHRVIAITWIPNPENKATVNHKNGIKDDNRAANLEWMTLSENHLHAWKTGLQDRARLHKPRNPVSEETRKKMSDAKKGRHREGSIGNWGKWI